MKHVPSGQHIASCPVHGKRLFTDRAKAKQAIRRLPSAKGMREYRCDAYEGHWHIGHLPLAVVTGEKSAREVYEPKASDEPMSEINEHLRGPWLAVLADLDGFVYPTFDEARKNLSDDAEMVICVVRGTALPFEPEDDPEQLRMPGTYNAGDLVFEIDAYMVDEDASLGAEARYAQAQAMADGLNTAAGRG